MSERRRRENASWMDGTGVVPRMILIFVVLITIVDAATTVVFARIFVIR